MDYVDARLVLRAAADAFPNGEFQLDVTDLEEGGWFDADVDPRDAALEHFGWVLSNGTPVAVLTEGSTDAAILGYAIQILRPHLQSFLRFPDFSVGAEGGASALVRLVRAMWAAGIANRVVALFDNDTAAAEALRALDPSALPSNFAVVVLPQLPLAESYPTVGPSGRSMMNVNGSAASIELYLGRDVLVDANGDLSPVQWTGLSSSLNRYHGEVVGKAGIRARFLDKVRRTQGSGINEDDDWSGLELVIDRILSALRSMSDTDDH
jgi:hypothetical protein